MLKKLLKMNLALLLAGSSASIINTNNIIFAEENSQDNNNSNMEQNEPLEKTIGDTTQEIPTISMFKLDNDTLLYNGKLSLVWDFKAQNEGDVSVKLEIKKKDDGDDKYILLANSGKSYEGNIHSDLIKDFKASDIVLRLTVTENGKSDIKTLDCIIKGVNFYEKSLYIGKETVNNYLPIHIVYTGESIDLSVSIYNTPDNMYALSYQKKNQSDDWEEVELPIIEAGEYQIIATANEIGEKYYGGGSVYGLFTVDKIDQPENKTLIKDHENTDITAGDSLVYQLVQEKAVKDDAKVEYTSNNEDVVTVDENGIMTLVSAGEYTIGSKILGSTNYKEKELASITGKITAGSLSLASTNFTTKANTQFDLDENVLFKTEAGKSIKGSELGNYNGVTYTVKANDLGVATGEATSIKPTKSGKLTVTVEVKQTDQAKALYNPLTQDVEINVEAISSGGSGGSSSSLFTGWKSNGSYYEKGKPANGIKEIKGVTYFFNEKGFPIKNQMIVIKEKTYITDGEGIFRKGKTEFEGATYVLDKTDGHMLKDWALVDGEWYFMNYETGKVHMNLWAPSASGDWYFMDAEGHMKKNQWIAASEGRWYYVGADGKMVSNGSVDGCWINEQGIYLSPMYKG